MFKFGRPFTIDDASLDATNVPEDETAYDPAHAYAMGDAIYKVIAGEHRRFLSAQNANTGHDPETDDGTWWTPDGITNRWAMFDGAVQTQTFNPNEIAVTFTLPPTTRIDLLWLGNLSATELRVIQTAPGIVGPVYDETISLVSTSGITDLYAYFFEPIARLKAKGLDDLRPYPGSTIEVSITEPGAMVGVGAVKPGFAKRLAKVRWGAELGIKDYSAKLEDDFGNLEVQKRAYRDLADFNLIVATPFVDEFKTLLTDYRATPVLIVGDRRFSSMWLWGFVANFKVVVSGDTVSDSILQFESLT